MNPFEIPAIWKELLTAASKLSLFALLCALSLLTLLRVSTQAQTAAPQARPETRDEYLERIFTTRPGVNTDVTPRKWLDVRYAPASAAQRLDLYLPPDGHGPFPVIVAIHGGSFVKGDKRDFQIVPMLAALAHGYAVASINYRLSAEATFPAQINDVKSAIRFLRAEAKRYGLDPDRLAVWGDSAGGDLAALAGTSAGRAELDDPADAHKEQSAAVKAVVDWYGPIDFLTVRSQPGQIVRNAMIGKSSLEAPELYLAASPATYISPDNPPFLIQHGDADRVIPTRQSQDFAARLTAALGPDKVALDIIPGADHLDEKFTTPDNIARVLRFLDRHLK